MNDTTKPQTFPQALLQGIAEVCHEANRALCQAHGDFSQLPWSDAADWQRQSAINGVNFRLNNPDAKPSAQHDAWMAEKLEQGWQHGPVKDPEKKQHPCIVPYEQLPAEQRAKDHVFGAIVDTLSRQIPL